MDKCKHGIFDNVLCSDCVSEAYEKAYTLRFECDELKERICQLEAELEKERVTIDEICSMCKSPNAFTFAVQRARQRVKERK